MKYNYDFDKIIDRTGTSCAKWDFTEEIFGEKDLLPMWVADMDFQSPPAIVDSLVKRAQHGFFGYSVIDPDYKEVVSSWFKRRHNWDVQPEWLTNVPQVINALSMSILMFTQPGDGVLIQTPCYDEFAKKTKETGRHVLDNRLICGPDGRYTIDFDDFEKKASDPRARLFLLCSPHNPTGRVWTREELERMSEICLRHNVLIFSDEIHGDMALEGLKHINLPKLNDEVAQNCIVATAISKTFNCPSLYLADIIIPNPDLKSRFDTLPINYLNFSTSPCFGIEGVKAAYTHGDEWLDQVLAYIKGNLEYASNFLKENAPHLRMNVPDGTYFGWLDCRSLGRTHSELEHFAVHKLKLAVLDGSQFGENGAGFLRLNLGTQRSRVETAMERIAAAAR
jgi:cystathionine beta-lyase